MIKLIKFSVTDIVNLLSFTFVANHAATVKELTIAILFELFNDYLIASAATK